MACFMERLRQAEAELAAAETVDPWRLTLERVRGKVDFFDGLERLSCQTLLDLSGGPPTSADGGHLSTSGEIDVRIGLDRSTGPRLDQRRI